MHNNFNIYTVSLKICPPFLTRLKKSSATRAFFKPERWKDVLQSILICSFVLLRFAIRFDRSIKEVMIMYAKLLCAMKMKTADHGLTAPAREAKAVISCVFPVYYRGTKMVWIWSESPSLPQPCLREGGDRGFQMTCALVPRPLTPLEEGKLCNWKH